MSGLNAFVMTNALLVNAGLTPTNVAPIAATPPGKPENVAAVSNAGVVTVTWDKPALFEVGAIARVWITSASGKFHRQMVDKVTVTTETLALVAVKAALGQSMNLSLLVGELVYIQVDTVNPTGGKSAGSNTAEVIVA
jgi:hypothetical protein